MQAVILAAGLGTRLSSRTGGLPKSFSVLNGEKLIDRNIRMLNERGVEDVHVVTGYKSEIFIKEINNVSQFHVNPLYFCTNVLASFAVAMHVLNDDFIFLHADTVFEEEILNRLIKSDGDVVLPIDYKEVGEEEMKVIVSSDQCVTALSKCLRPEVAHGEFIGLARIRKSVLPELKKSVTDILKYRNFQNSFFEESLNFLRDNGFKLTALDVTGCAWSEIDFPEDLDYAQAVMKNK